MAAVRGVRDLFQSGWRFLLLEFAAPFVAYVIAIGILSATGGLFEFLLSLLPALISLGIGLVVIGALLAYWEAILGVGVIALVVVAVAGAFFIGLEELVGPSAGRIATLAVDAVTFVLVLVLLLALLGLGLVVLGAAAVPFWFVLIMYRETYDEVDLSVPAAWLVPPVVALAGLVAWATVTGAVSQPLLAALFFAVGSLAVRTAVFVDCTTASDAVRGEVPPAAFAVPLGAALLIWALQLEDPGTLRDIRPWLRASYDAVRAGAPFAVDDDVAAVTILVPGVLFSGVTALGHGLAEGVRATLGATTGSGSSGGFPRSSGSSGGSGGSSSGSGSGSSGSSSGAGTGSSSSSSSSGSGGASTGAGTVPSGEEWTTLNTGRGLAVHVAALEARGTERLCVAFDYDQAANSDLRNSGPNWQFYKPGRGAASPLDGVAEVRCWYADHTPAARQAVEDVFGVDLSGVVAPPADADSNTEIYGGGTGDTQVYDGDDDDGTGDTKVWTPDDDG